jgi:hypothetical protein
MDITTRNFIVTTVGGFIALALWVAASLASPLIVLDETVKGVLFVIAFGALGLGQYTAFKAVNTVQALSQFGPDKKSK